MQFSLYILLIFLYFLAAAFLKGKKVKRDNEVRKEKGENKRACHRLMTHPRLDFINYIITSKLKSLLKIFLRLLQGNLDSSLSSTDNVQARSQATTLQIALQGSHRSLQTCHAEAVERIDICLE